MLLVACHPSASVQNVTSVGNLQAVHSVGLRVHSSSFATQGVAMMMENAVAGHLKQQCSFEQIAPAAQAPADLVLDINIVNSGRGTEWGGSQTTIDTLLVLSDGEGDPLGTAKIRGRSSGSITGGGGQDSEAIEVIAKTIADMLAKSGCAGPRLAKAAPDPVPDAGVGSGSAAGPGAPDESKRAEADALNDKGKDRLFNADSQGALGFFQQAEALLPDPKYQFNVCVALGALEQWDAATQACNQAKGMNPPPKLAAKIDQRLQGLAQHQ